MDAGLQTLPGTAAEILDDPVRQLLCPDKLNTHECLEAHRTAHSAGPRAAPPVRPRSSATDMLGPAAQPPPCARHLIPTRGLRRETGGFAESVPLPSVPMAAPIGLEHKARRGPTFREALLLPSGGR